MPSRTLAARPRTATVSLASASRTGWRSDTQIAWSATPHVTHRGHAKKDDFTVLIAINFSVSDIDLPPERANEPHDRPKRGPEDKMPGLADDAPLANP